MSVYHVSLDGNKSCPPPTTTFVLRASALLLYVTRYQKVVFFSPQSASANCPTVPLQTRPQLAYTRHRTSSLANHTLIRHPPVQLIRGRNPAARHPSAVASDTHRVTPCSSSSDTLLAFLIVPSGNGGRPAPRRGAEATASHTKCSHYTICKYMCIYCGVNTRGRR